MPNRYVSKVTNMLFRKEHLEQIRKGEITLAFRRWKRPSVKAGSTLLTPAGELEIRSIVKINRNEISPSDSHQAGYTSHNTLLKELDSRSKGDIYRIELGELRADPRVALRNLTATGKELSDLLNRLNRMDSRSPDGPWTFQTLEVLEVNSGVRAGDLCELVDQEKERFKTNVRKLKNLGLTISLGTGYKLSVRGKALLRSYRNINDQ